MSMRFSALLGCAVASAALIAGSPAAAQQIDRIVAFGDSYADDGNLFELLGIARPAVYPNGRFSNGTNFVDTMGQILGVPIDNFAIGGAFTGNGNINGPGIPGFVTEYQSYLAGGGPAAFPRVSGTFDASDLVVVSIGGNDARAYERSLGLTPTSAQIATLIAGVPAQAQLRVAEAATGLNALANAGASNITFLAGDVGRLPEVRGLPVAAVGTAYASAFNSGMQAQLATLAAQGVTVNYLDLNAIGDVVEANLDAFGLISSGACPVACVTTDPSLLNRYLFYVDQVHLTSAGFAIVGQYAVRQLEAPLVFEAQSGLGLSAASGFGQLMSGRLDVADAEDGLAVYLVGAGARQDVAASATGYGYDYDSFGVAGGAEFGFGAGLAGLAVAYSRPNTDFAGGRARADAWHIGGYAQLEMGGAFVEGYAGYGWLDYELERRAFLDDPITAETDGTGLVLGGEAGFLFGLSGVRAGPVVGVQYARARLDGYTESGDPVLTLNVEDRRVSRLVGFAGAEVDFDADLGGLAIEPFVKLLAEKELDSSSRSIRYANTTAPGIVNSFEPGQQDDDVYGRIEGGVSFDLGSAIAVQVQASATVEHPQGDELSGFIGVKLGF
jgi:outer membrane lipase/esterase